MRPMSKRRARTYRGGLAAPALCLALATLGWLAALAVVRGEDQAAAGRGKKPNVVVVMTDDQDARSLRVMGAVKRQLQRKGTTFRNAFATFPLCCPSRATFLTGQYAHNHGVLSNTPPDGGFEAFRDARTLATSMKRAGYRTGWIGKYLNGYGSRGNNRRYIPPGWDEWRAPVGQVNRLYDYTLNENGHLRDYGSEPRDYQTDVFARKAARFIRRSARRPKPFFLTVATGPPHSEGGRTPGSLNPRPARRHKDRFRQARLPDPPSFNEANVSDKPAFVRNRPRLDREQRRRLTLRYRGRLASLLAVDDAVDEIIRQLREERELGGTVVIFTSDNGFLLGEHRLFAKTALYEESIRVPLIARGPGFGRGAKRSQPTGNVDLAPTILDLAGARPGRAMDGGSLLPLARSPSVGADRDILLENLKSTGIRTRRFMYAEHPGGERELYDLAADPFQLRSRHDDPAFRRVREQLADRLSSLRDCSGSACR
jgi:N-acetylglucosamine-6-sulfatase